MRRVFLLLAFGFLTVGAIAQGKGRDYIIRKQDGKMYWIRSGQTIKLAIPVPLKNGSTAYPNGSLQTKDSTLSMLAQGDKVLMDGTVIPKHKGKQRQE